MAGQKKKRNAVLAGYQKAKKSEPTTKYTGGATPAPSAAWGGLRAPALRAAGPCKTRPTSPPTLPRPDLRSTSTVQTVQKEPWGKTTRPGPHRTAPHRRRRRRLRPPPTYFSRTAPRFFAAS